MIDFNRSIWAVFLYMKVGEIMDFREFIEERFIKRN